MQLDLFEHSHDVMLRNDVLHALERRDAAAAESAWQALRAHFDADPALPALAVLVEAMQPGESAPFTDFATLRTARTALSVHVEPVALQLFGAQAGADWLIPFWRALAGRAAPLEFGAEHGDDDHAAPLWLRAGDMAAAIDAAGRIESWRRIPQPLGWMTEARYRTAGLAVAWPLWAELAWLAPKRFDSLSQRLADPVLGRLRKRFDADFEGDGDVADLAWFPAWVLTDDPSQSQWLRAVQRSRGLAPELALHALLALLGLERQGRHHELIERRKVLRDLNPSLYASYLRTR